MIKNLFYPQGITNTLNETVIRFTMVGAGAADLTAGIDSTAMVVSAVYSATGLYAVTVRSTGKQLVSSDVKIRSATNNQLSFQNWTAATGVLNLRVFTSPNTAAPVALNDIVEFTLRFKDA